MYNDVFLVTTIMTIILCFFMCCTGAWANKACKTRMWGLWPFGVAGQLFFLIYMPFYNREGLTTSGHITVYEAIQAYADMPMTVWFWTALTIGGVFTLLNILLPFLHIEETKTPG